MWEHCGRESEVCGVGVAETETVYDVKAKKEKCVFFSKTVEYVGHRIEESGLHTLDY